MDRIARLLLDLRSYVCRHLQIGDSLAGCLSLQGERLAVEQPLVRHPDLPRSWI
jgi:hypothetical protein